MAVVNPPGWLQNAGATHTASQMRSYLGAMLGAPVSVGSLVAAGGVSLHLGNKLQVTQSGSPAMSVIVKSGVAWIGGTESATQGVYGVMNDADVTLSISAAHASLARIDLVVFKVEDSQYSGAVNTASLAVVTGTPAGSPSAPSAPNNSTILAQVLVGAAVSSITNANITDRRSYLPSGSGGRHSETVYFTSSGSFTKATYPGLTHVVVEVQAGGGGSGGCPATIASQASGGGAGGGGGYARKLVLASALGTSETVTVGAGGTAGASGVGTGGTGGTSSFGSHCVATGGDGGVAGSASTGQTTATPGDGGIGTTGDLLLRGDDGDEIRIVGGWVVSTASGGRSHLGARGRASVSSVGGGASTGDAYGSGSSGPHNNASQAARTGAVGGAGIVIVHVFLV